MVTRAAWTYFLGLATRSTNLLFEAANVRDNINNVSDWSLRFLIPVVDSWFGIVTTPVQQTQLQVIAPPKGSFGRGIIDDYCAQSSNNGSFSGSYQPCTIATGEKRSALSGEGEAYKIPDGVSDTNVVREYSPNPDQVFYFLGDVGSSNSLRCNIHLDQWGCGRFQHDACEW